MGQAATFYHQHHFIYLINITLAPLLKVAICVLSNGKTLIYSSRDGTTISTRPATSSTSYSTCHVMVAKVSNLDF